MPLIRLVRHAEPAALWGAHPDPGLSEKGRGQAAAVAGVLTGVDAPVLLTSPLARCRETAAPLEDALGRQAQVERAVAEVPTPTGLLDTRAWLTAVMGGTWHSAGPELRHWRDAVAATLMSLSHDAIIFSHFVAINAAVSVALGEDAVTVFKPGHASVTVLSASGGRLSVVALGDEAAIALA
jgi:broad specificity phosphatase PhoE